MLENSKHIIIVGAGIAGLTAALSLRHYGIRASIYERSPEIITAGAGIQLSPNANRVLSRIGVLKEISSVSIAVMVLRSLTINQTDSLRYSIT